MLNMYSFEKQARGGGLPVGSGTVVAESEDQAWEVLWHATRGEHYSGLGQAEKAAQKLGAEGMAEECRQAGWAIGVSGPLRNGGYFLHYLAQKVSFGFVAPTVAET